MIGGMKCYYKFAIVGGLVLTVFSLLWPTILSTLMYRELKLAPGSKTFQHWVKTPVPMYIDIYFHNWTNPHEVYTRTPVFSQMGPYRFYEQRTKVNLVWNDNGTVSYRQTRHWHFDPSHSNGTLKDNVTTVNLIAASVAHKLRFHSPNEQNYMSWAFTGLDYEVEVVKTVEELLFDGYTDQLLSIIKYLPEYSREVSDKFGWFYNRNGSMEVDGLFNMDTGANDLKHVGKIRSWNNRNKTGYFKGQCGDVAGTSGEVFPPWLTPKDRIGLFSGDLCRTIYLSYSDEVIVDGIQGLKFSGGTHLVDSGHIDDTTTCYRNGESVPLGLLNLTECRLGAPIFVSYPHFYLGEDSLRQQVEGLTPKKELHSFDVVVEPTLGVPLDIKGRFQVNVMLQPNKHYLLYRNLPRRMFLPLLWFDQRASLTSELSDEVRLMVTLYHVSTNIALCLLVLGLLSVAVGVTSACRTFNKSPPNKVNVYTTVIIPTSGVAHHKIQDEAEA